MHRKQAALGRIRWLVIGPFLVVVMLLAGVAAMAVDTLSAVRAYVGGESLWSKGQKDAVHHISRYVMTHDPADYQRFQGSLAVAAGDRRARQALDQPHPDLQAARQGFLAGGNHPDDIDGMVRLYLRFRDMSFMRDAIRIWAQADDQLGELGALAHQVHARIATGDTGSPQLALLVQRLPETNARLTALGQRFSAALGEASRTARRLVLVVTLLLAGGLCASGLALTAYVLRLQARAESALRESNDRWALAASAAGLGLFDWDLRARRATLDARGAALYGLSPHPVEVGVDELVRTAVHPEDGARLCAAMGRSHAHAAPISVRFRVQVGGDVRHLEAIANVRQRQGGDPTDTRMVGVLRDVSDEVQATQLQLDKEAAERASRAKGEFLSRVSHELRTPLNAVLGFSELLQTDPEDALTPSQNERVQYVLDAGRHLLALINDILDLSSLEEGTSVAIVPVALVPLMTSALSRVQPEALKRQLQLTAPDLPAGLQVLGDARRLEQALVNVLSNAVKYNREGGEVRVSCQLGGVVEITVRDTGAGLRPDQIEQLFQPFNRLGAEYSQVPGSGLGLVITQELVQRMGGSVTVHSTEGVGTAVTLRLRRAAQLPVSAA